VTKFCFFWLAGSHCEKLRSVTTPALLDNDVKRRRLLPQPQPPLTGQAPLPNERALPPRTGFHSERLASFQSQCSLTPSASPGQAVKARVRKLLGSKAEKKSEKKKEAKEETPGDPQRDSQLREAAFKGTLCRAIAEKRAVYAACTEEDCPGQGSAEGQPLEECGCHKILDFVPVTVLVSDLHWQTDCAG
jgi:hypothetical protein